MPSDDFPNAPDMGRDFFNNRLSPEPDWDARSQAKQENQGQELDHLESSLDYTPGGQLEQDVHTQLSDNARREIKLRTQQGEKSQEGEYLDQVQDRFDKQVAEKEQERNAELQEEEREARLLKILEEKQQEAKARHELDARSSGDDKASHAQEQSVWKSSSYDMPEQDDHAGASDATQQKGNARPRPGRSERGGPDRSGGGHEH